MKHLLTPAIALAASAAWAIVPQAIQTESTVGSAPAPTEVYSGIQRLTATAGTGSLDVDFTVAGTTSAEPVAAYDFNSGLQGWTCEATANVTWSVEKATDSHAFTDIDPDDAGSLFVSGPYQQYKREKSTAVSPAIAVPAEAQIVFYAGFTQNEDNYCRLHLEVSDDDFATATELWHSGMETGEKPWRWHRASASLAAWAGKTVKLRFTYGPGTDDTFDVGGYMGDFYIDGITVSGAATIESVNLVTGERLTLQALGLPDDCTYLWSMPGAVPASSTEAEPTVYYTTDGTYDISLTVTAPSGDSGTRTRPGFVTVTGTAPTARIVPPATFRYSNTRLPMVCPSVPVTYTHDNAGFPTTVEWTVTGTDPDDATKAVTIAGQTATVRHHFLHNQLATMTAANSHGNTADMAEVSVEYQGSITNLRPGEIVTAFDMGDWGVFPGSNTRGITAYAERFSKPSHPIVINGVNAFFTKVVADNISDQIANVGVSLYTSVDGLPGECLDTWWWQVSDLSTPTDGMAVGTPFQFTPRLIDDEFFIVVDGLPAYSEPKPATDGMEASAGTCVSLGMAPFRAEGNTTFMKRDGKWIDVSTYFPAGQNHTSLAVHPVICHSVVETNPIGIEEYTVDGDAGETVIGVFSLYGWKAPVATSNSWLRVTNTPGELTVDELHVAYDALPDGVEKRSAVLTLTDGFTSRDITVTQSADYDGISAVGTDPTGVRHGIYDLQGRRYAPDAQLAPGVYIIDGQRILK